MGRQTLSSLNNDIFKLKNLISEKDEKITELNTSISGKDEKITELNTSISEKDEKITELNTSISEKDKKITELNISILEKDEKITELNTSISEKIIKIKNFELRKFAISFSKEKDEYKKNLDIWSIISISSFIILFIATCIITYISFSLSIDKKISLIFIEMIPLLFTLFSVKQYLFYSTNYSKSLRRTALAQGYQYIFEGKDDKEIEPDYKEKLVEVICETTNTENNYKFPQEQILDKISDLTDVIIKIGKKL